VSSSERGSALVDFVFLAVPFALIPLSVISVSFVSYAQAVLLDSAIEGARYAALADQDSSGGCKRSLELAKKAFHGFFDMKASCSLSGQSNEGFEKVVLLAKIPVFGMITFSPELRATGRAPREN
jgi:heme exporter protein D